MYGDRLYWKESGIWLAAHASLMILCFVLWRRLPDASLWRYVLIGIPVLSTVPALVIELRMLRRVDELQRRVYLEAATSSLLLTSVYVGSCIALQAGVRMPPPPQYWTLVVLGIGFFIGLAVARRRYL